MCLSVNPQPQLWPSRTGLTETRGSDVLEGRIRHYNKVRIASDTIIILGGGALPPRRFLF